jgi:hypothetical protein
VQGVEDKKNGGFATLGTAERPDGPRRIWPRKGSGRDEGGDEPNEAEFPDGTKAATCPAGAGEQFPPSVNKEQLFDLPDGIIAHMTR